MIRTHFIITASVIILPGMMTALAKAANESPKRPNIIYIMTTCSFVKNLLRTFTRFAVLKTDINWLTSSKFIDE